MRRGTKFSFISCPLETDELFLELSQFDFNSEIVQKTFRVQNTFDVITTTARIRIKLNLAAPIYLVNGDFNVDCYSSLKDHSLCSDSAFYVASDRCWIFSFNFKRSQSTRRSHCRGQMKSCCSGRTTRGVTTEEFLI